MIKILLKEQLDLAKALYIYAINAQRQEVPRLQGGGEILYH